MNVSNRTKNVKPVYKLGYDLENRIIKFPLIQCNKSGAYNFVLVPAVSAWYV